MDAHGLKLRRLVTLTDTGPLVALIDTKDAHHKFVADILVKIKSWPLVTTEACLTETLYLLGEDAGWQGQAALWRFISDGSLQILPTPLGGPIRASVIMERFRDLPCDYADATLIVAAEDIGLKIVFTLDSHFHAYRLINGESLTVLS
jgi:predicted nucleic acid-binding protein